MKHLKVEVNGNVWVNGDFAEIAFTDGPSGVKIEGKTTRTNGGGGGLLDLFAGASRNRTEAMVEEKRATLDAPTPVEAVEAEPVD